MDKILKITYDDMNGIIEQESQDIVDGNCEDWEHYRERVGFIKGVKSVKNFIDSQFQSPNQEGSVSNE